MAFVQGGPDAATVATRAVILKAVVIAARAAPPRGFMDHWTRVEMDEFTSGAEKRCLQTSRALGDLASALTPWEQAFFAASAATMTLQQQIDASWRLESFQVLLWALNVVEKLPDYDVQASADILQDYPKGDTGAAIRSATLRSSASIERERDIAELWHWRSRTRELVERGHPFPASPRTLAKGFGSYDDIILAAATRAANDGVTKRVGGDFSLNGKAYRDLTNEEWFEARSIAVERHFALNWLSGFAPSNSWDETPTDT